MTVYSEWWIFHLFELQEIETYFAVGKKIVKLRHVTEYTFCAPSIFL